MSKADNNVSISSMRSAWVVLACLALSLIILAIMAGRCRAEDVTEQPANAVTLQRGQAAPYDGELLNAAAIVKMIGEIRDARARMAIIENLTAEVMLREKQNEYLKGAMDVAQKAADIAQKNAQDNTELLSKLAQVIDTNGEVLKQNQVVIASNVHVIESMQKEIENLRKERRWAMIAGPIGLGLGLLLGQFGVGFFH